MIIDGEFEIINEFGLHARPSASFVKMANQFESKISVEYDNSVVDGKSIVGLLTLGIGTGEKLKITADGKDAKNAIKQLGKLISDGFGEVSRISKKNIDNLISN